MVTREQGTSQRALWLALRGSAQRAPCFDTLSATVKSPRSRKVASDTGTRLTRRSRTRRETSARPLLAAVRRRTNVRGSSIRSRNRRPVPGTLKPPKTQHRRSDRTCCKSASPSSNRRRSRCRRTRHRWRCCSCCLRRSCTAHYYRRYCRSLRSPHRRSSRRTAGQCPPTARTSPRPRAGSGRRCMTCHSGPDRHR